ncbi:flagellar hook-associated protein FlgK [Pseudomonas mosselii]|uniref:flagellar hook-associated protein FlgK n=1 Tax=Pseudomonas mosselii TaxID=78327 RepID=UPI00244A0264|nr:flagellar hook-associated protein FlgK [Pseudomonas mosselii]MDH0628372.1 flagellar hook-associated protein FlgK [Pseudomonas mosselii]MDH0679611.1 flagellar hook-associated protein FlgK [Pseudomonas mosselii]MDH0927119.1 flagellar hook-associated protein FlgK [Pseudomonas mosselii]MDH1135403.1 flagellar hook-associated protein FlgK [Pseudomonas mosselii]MDH1140840.1 flagellar hook-associated protein FlgK [Pseudomonas mosselii]
MSLISIGLSGLNASQTALSITGNNIANAAVSGYSRQQTIQTTGPSHNIGTGFVGTGTTLSDVRRIYNAYLDNQLQTSTSLNTDAAAFQDQITGIDKLLAESDTGISSVLTAFFSALQTASAKPSDVASRQLLLTQAQTLSNRFNAISSQMSKQNDSINSQLDTLSGQVNKLTSSIADLNKQITQLSASGASPNNLLDARSEAVRQLNELVGVTVQERDGNYDVYLGNGQSLVTGNRANTLTAVPSAADQSQYSLQINYPTFSSDVTSVVTGGQIGGLLRYRNDVLTPSMNELGRVALVVADSINSQLGQGLDANAQFGSALFSSINSALAISQRSLASTNNSAGSGNLDVTIANSGALTTYDYEVKFTGPNQYSVRRSDGTDMGNFDLTTTPPPVIDGFTLKLNGGGLAAGDTFKVSPTRSAAGSINTVLTDANKLAFAGPINGIVGSGNTGSGTITQPNLGAKLDIYGGADTALIQDSIKHSMPVRMVFQAASGGTQGYTLYDSKGNSIGTGTIVPGQDNKLTINVPMRDASGAPILDGSGNPRTFSVETTVGGSPATNDSFTFGFNADGKSDNRNSQALLGLQTKSTVGVTSGGGSSFTSAYASLVERVGAKANQAKIDTVATKAVLDAAKESRNGVSGVNLDDEAANLIKFQHYYTASSQIIKAAQETFSILINAL